MPRIKKEIEYLNLDQVNELLYEHAVLEANGEDIRNSYDYEIKELEAQRDADYGPIKLRLLQLKNRIHNYLTQHVSEFMKPRSKELTFGVIGFRTIRSDKIKIDDEDLALAWLRENGRADLIRTREVLDIDAIAKLTPDEFARIEGISRPKEKDNPWFETKRGDLPVA